MVRYYIMRINDGKIDLKDVPPKWRSQVEEEILKQK